MEEKINIVQNGTSTNISTTNDIREISVTFEKYSVNTLKIVFKDEKDYIE
jgi:hypothetical protein